MSLRHVFCLSTALLFIGITQTVKADVPTGMNVQGILTDATGVPPPVGIKMFTFKIFDAPSDGNEIWPGGSGEDQMIGTDATGLWEAHLGAIIPLDGGVFADTARWLEITVDDGINPVSTLPRIKLNTVAFAYHSLMADTSKLSLSVGLDAVDSTGIINGGLSFADLGQNSAATGQVMKWNGSQWIAAEVDSSGIINGGISFSDLGQNSAATGQVIKWNGSQWIAANDEQGSVSDADWLLTGKVLFTGGEWGLARVGNILYGDYDSTHVNLGVACTTGTTGQDKGWVTIAGGSGNVASGAWAMIGGGQQNVAGDDHATVGGGYRNRANGRSSVVGGGGKGELLGGNNLAAGDYSTVGGGIANVAGGYSSTVSGGGDMNGTVAAGNYAMGDFAAIGGGSDNKASEYSATVAGGSRNIASDSGATIGGGLVCQAQGPFSVVAGGGSNSANNRGTAIGGGLSNATWADYSVIGGGRYNQAWGMYSVIAGGGGSAWSDSNSAVGDFSVIGGGTGNITTDEGCVISGGGKNRARGRFSVIGGGGGTSFSDSNSALGDYSVVSGGHANVAGGNGATVAGGFKNVAGSEATIGGGLQNEAGGNRAVIGGGDRNTADAWWTTIGGGLQNNANGSTATIGGGEKNVANGIAATTGGGKNNYARGDYSTISGGGGDPADSNSAGGDYSMIPGGRGNTAAGNHSFAGGRQAKATGNGTFVWADDNDFEFPSPTEANFTPAAKMWLVRSTGGVVLVSGIDGSGNSNAGVQLAPGGGSWSSLSDRNLKENFRPVDGATVLAKIAALPINSWNYKAQADSIRHIGPVAQDLYAAFGVGEDDRHITTIDADGIALAAIKELSVKTQQVEQQAKRIEQLETDNAALKNQMVEVQATLKILLAEKHQRDAR